VGLNPGTPDRATSPLLDLKGGSIVKTHPIVLRSDRRAAPRGRRALLVAVSVVAILATVPSSAGAFVTGVYGRDSSLSGTRIIRNTGFNTVYMSVNLGNIGASLNQMDRLHARGMRVVVWLGTYDRDVCRFERTGDWIRQVVGAIADHPAIAAYQIGDEVDRARARGCTGVASAVTSRSQLIKSIDPGAATYVTITVNDGTEAFPYERFAGTGAILGLVVYPCVKGKSVCIWERIDKAIAEADRDGVARYWVVAQDFGNTTYRQPSAAELDKQLQRWHGSRVSGLFIFHWVLGNLEHKPAHLEVLAKQNHYFRTH
jgi:hypothetical protein